MKAAVAAADRAGGPDRPPVVCFYTLSSGDWGGASRVLFTNLRMLDRTRVEPLLVLPGRGPIEPELVQRDLRYHVAGPMREPGNVWRYLRAFFRALHFFRREKVAVIHVNGANFWRPAELLAARVCGIPILAHYHVVNAQPSPAMSWCRGAIAVSRYTAAQSRPRDLAKPVIHNPIDLMRFDRGRSLRPELGIVPTAPVVLFVGQIRDIKGIDDFIAMAHRVADPDAVFLIAGECRDPRKFAGSLTEADLARLIGDDRRIRYLGYLTNVEDLYHTADIVVMPSRWQEPLGLINLEAGACRRPVVATRVGGIPEVVQDGVNGRLVPAADVVALAVCVGELIADPALRRRMGDAGRTLVETKYSTRPVREFEALLQGLARGGRNTRATHDVRDDRRTP